MKNKILKLKHLMLKYQINKAVMNNNIDLKSIKKMIAQLKSGKDIDISKVIGENNNE